MANPCQLLAVTGSPILHSLSPPIHTAALEALGDRDTCYTRLAASSAAEALRVARAVGIRGLNATAPFKEELAGLVDRLDPVAARLRAVNTVLLDGDRSRGFNTDPAGVLAGLAAAGADPAAGPAVVLGAGGAGRAAVHALGEAGFSEITVLNRTPDRAAVLADHLGCAHASLDRATAIVRDATVVISCLPGSVAALRAGWLRAEQVVLDAAYSASGAARAARKAGCKYLDGRRWLVGQARASFRLFTGVAVPTGAMGEAAVATRSPSRTVYLAGMMGVGKSAVGRLLAARLRCPFLDLDEEIERRAGRRIPAIFATGGEAEFRRLEAATLRSVAPAAGVIALGGGALEDPASRELVTRAGTVCWLWAAPSTCAARASGDDRPLLAAADPVVRITELLEQRRPDYAAAADLLVGTEGLTAAQVAERIFDEIDRT